jgi:hypothetical protein
MNDCTTRQYVAHMLDLLGLKRKAHAALTTASEKHMAIYIEIIKIAAKSRRDIAEFLWFSGVDL